MLVPNRCSVRIRGIVSKVLTERMDRERKIDWSRGRGRDRKRVACGLAGGKSWDEQHNTASHDSR